MLEESYLLAERCLRAAHDDAMSFRQMVEALSRGGFEGYQVDFRRDAACYYHTVEGAYDFALPGVFPKKVAPRMDIDALQKVIDWAMLCADDYRYHLFCDRVQAAGCAGYQVSFPGRRILYYAKTAEVHVTHFPD